MALLTVQRLYLNYYVGIRLFLTKLFYCWYLCQLLPSFWVVKKADEKYMMTAGPSQMFLDYVEIYHISSTKQDRDQQCLTISWNQFSLLLVHQLRMLFVAE